MIGYYAYILDFVIPKLLCVLMYLYVLLVYNSIWKFTVITIINYYLYHNNELISIIAYLNYRTALA